MINQNLYNSPDVANRIKGVAKRKGIALKDILTNCELGSNTFSHMLHGRSMAFDSLAHIADYLDCPIDYLLGRGLFENWETILEHKEQIISNMEDVYPFLKEYHLCDLPETALMRILPSILGKVIFEDNAIKLFFL